MSFAHPFVLVLLVVPALAALAGSGTAPGGRVALPFDHGRQGSGTGLGVVVDLAESLPALILAVVVVLLAGPQQHGRAEDEADADEHRVLRRRLRQHDSPRSATAPATTPR